MTVIAVVDEAVPLDAPLRLEKGGVIQRCRVGLRRVGDFDAPAVLVLGGISATRRVTSAPGETGAGWWDPVIDASAVLSGGAVQLVGADFLAGEGLSSLPCDGVQLTTGDQAEAIARACITSGIETVAAVVGASYGGMVALSLAARRTTFARRIVAISAADRSHPMASAVRWIQREIVRLGEASGRAQAGVALARALAMTTYRTADEFHERFGEGPDGAGAVTAYLTSRGEAFAGRWTAGRFRQISESLDLHQVDPKRIGIPVTLVGVVSDTLVPVRQLQALRESLGPGEPLHLLDSPWGHDAFLKEPTAIARLIDRSLTSLSQA
jgi:homoserine O-acetyltransferase/O-succinyltransferase